MMCMVGRLKTFSILFLFGICICICIWGIGTNPATAQSYFSYPYNPIYGNLFGGLGMPASGPLFTSNYQQGQTWNPFGSNLNPDLRVFPASYYPSLSPGSTQTKKMAAGELLIHLSNQVQIEHHANGPVTNIPELNALIEQYGIYDIQASETGAFYVLKFSKSHDVNDVRSAFEDLTDYVESAEPNYIRRAHTATTSSSLNTRMGGLTPLTSFFPGSGFSYPGTGLTFGSQFPMTQSSYSNFPFSQLTFGPGLTYSPSWQNRGLSFLQPSFNAWQQTSWGMPQPSYINPFPGNWFSNTSQLF